MKSYSKRPRNARQRLSSNPHVADVCQVVSDDLAQDVVELLARLESKQGGNLRRVGNTSRHILEAFFVGFPVRDKDNLGF